MRRKVHVSPVAPLPRALQSQGRTSVLPTVAALLAAFSTLALPTRAMAVVPVAADDAGVQVGDAQASDADAASDAPSDAVAPIEVEPRLGGVQVPTRVHGSGCGCGSEGSDSTSTAGLALGGAAFATALVRRRRRG